MAHLISYYANFVTRMKDLVDVAISKVSDENGKKQLDENLNTILETSITSDYGKDKSRKYGHLMRDSFKINIVMRIERTNYINSIYNKIGDLTFETINKLIKEGECDAWFSIIQNDINNMDLAADIRDRLICSLKRAMENLRKSDYEDNNSQTYYMLNQFVELNNGVRLDPHQSAKLARSIDALKAILCST